MRLGRAGAIGAARARSRKTNTEQELAVRAGEERARAQDRAIARASDASRENARHSDLEFGNSRNNEGSSASREGVRAAENSDREQPATGSIIKGSNTHDLSNGILIPTTDNINVSSKGEQKIVFRRYPCTLWIAGTFIMSCGLYLIYHLALG